VIDVRTFDQLGGANHGWLDAKHHFSFASYYDPNRMGWGAMRVWNDDTIQPHTGFPPHPHSDMEIITYVRKGAISHRDNQGNAGRTEAGDVQVMSAGSGIAHSEYNNEDEATQIFQIWIQPTEKGGEPSWGARRSLRFLSSSSMALAMPSRWGTGRRLYMDSLTVRSPWQRGSSIMISGATSLLLACSMVPKKV
jgi:redox-sensitive bicupin YhaK (pirin superfamily)